MSAVVAGAAVGVGVGVGLSAVALHVPPARRIRLDDRLAPYLQDSPRPSSLLSSTPAGSPPVVARLLAPVAADLVGLLDRLVGGAPSVRRRLEAAGRDQTVERFRLEQLEWGAVGLLAGLGLVAALMARGVRNPLPLVVMAVLVGLAGTLARDRWLSREVRQRAERAGEEFPTVAELLALALTAGEAPLAALDRVSRASSGELAAELRRTVAEVRAGARLSTALETFARRLPVPSLARFVDALVVAIERGTPLADVVRAQAADAREAGRRALLDAGGKREIAMLLPVVFLILPVTIVFLVFPGFYGLGFTVP